MPPAIDARPAAPAARATRSSAAAATSLTRGDRHEDDPRPPTTTTGPGRPAIGDGRARPRHRRAELRSPRSRPATSTSPTSRRSTRPGSPTTTTLGPQLRRTRRPLAPVLRLRHVAAAVRRRPGPPGVRPGGRLAAARSPCPPAGAATPATGHGPARHPRPERRRTSCPPTIRTGRGRCSPTPASRAAPASRPSTLLGGGGHGPRVRRRDQARARGDRPGRAPGRRASSTGSPTIRRRSSRWAGSPTTRARTTSSASCSAPAPRTTTGAGRRRAFDQAIADALAATRSGGGAGGVRPGRGDRPRRGADDPADLRRRLVARADRAARRLRQRARDHPDGGARVGPLTPAGGARRGGSPPLVAWRGRRPRWSVGPRRRVAAADPVTFGEPTRDLDVRQGDRVRAAGHARRRRRSGSRSCSRRPGAIGPTVVPRPDADDGRRVDPRLPGRPAPTATSSRTRRSRPAGGSTDADGTDVARAAASRHVYADDRFDWKTLDGDVVRVHWVEGNQAFGQRALKIGDDAVAATAKLLGVTESDPIDFFIYADQDAFYDALGPATRENVGGQAHPGHPDAVRPDHPGRHQRQLGRERRPPRADPRRVPDGGRQPVPRSAALAERGPRGLPVGRLRRLRSPAGRGGGPGRLDHPARRPGRRVPDDAATGSSSPTPRACRRSTGSSGSTAATPSSKLIRSYADGVSDDEAFQAALGRDVAGFEADWLAELGAEAADAARAAAGAGRAAAGGLERAAAEPVVRGRRLDAAGSRRAPPRRARAATTARAVPRRAAGGDRRRR